MKPFLACDVDFDKVLYPLMLSAKIDGVRARCVDSKLVGRSGKRFKNKLNTEFFSDPRFDGFDGEMVVSDITGFNVNTETTSALSTIKGTIETRWCLFDFVVDGVNNKAPYRLRYEQLKAKLNRLFEADPSLRDRLWLIPYHMVVTKGEIEHAETILLEQGYEGVILRSLNGAYKYGRCTAKESDYLRLKRFKDAEIRVTSLREGVTNLNELKRDPNGKIDRSTHAENMVPNGMVGTIIGEVLETQKLGEKVLFSKGDIIEVAPGKMTHELRAHYLAHPNEIINHIIKYQYFPYGIKDKPRFPTFQGFRDPVDL